jgi:hypothetical protein
MCLHPRLFQPKPDDRHPGFSLTRLDEHPFHPAQLDELDTAQVADPEMVLFIRHHDVGGGDIQSAVFAKKSDPLCLEQMSAYRIYGYGIGSHDQPL